ncbi:PAP/OAS1 substrate-binding domain-containing protein [Peniophora sp. CONT]|nr:PAP/OAS1 substrate-binding domain-containing protein [Peniophora sp. CONT]
MAVSTQPSTPPLPHQSSSPSIKRRDSGSSRIRFNAELSQCLFDFVIQLLPTVDELAVKEDVRKLLERLIRTIEPDSRLLSFGSTANGFSLRNSDMDLCCLIDSEERLAASDLVTMLGDLLERETKFHVKPLPHARIPIVKLSLDPSPGLPLGIACDIGFENRLALENTRLLYCYAMIDPTRVRTMVLFLKVWAKRRKINSPYKGTLSSYGYVLLVIYFLVHVKNPPVLPNLQQMPPLRPISQADTHIGGNNVWFFDDIELLRQRWQSANHESVAQLLTDFFKFYARDFLYNTGVVSIRGGHITKGSKGWQNESSRYKDSRERNRFCIEDPFEIDFNVARCVTRDGLYTIRGEFMRASRILSLRPERAILAIAQLCEERSDVLGPTPTTPSSVPPRLSPFPPQTPYTVGSSPMRPNEIHMPAPSRASPPSASDEPTRVPSIAPPESDTPEHMAPQRHKWTSPPPANAPSADHLSFENRLGLGLSLATVPGTANIRQNDGDHSSNASEIYTDEGDVDEIRSMISDSPTTLDVWPTRS